MSSAAVVIGALRVNLKSFITHCYMSDVSICCFRGVGSILSLLFYFLWKILLANNVDPDQMPNYVVSDLSLHCLLMTLL